MTQYVHIPHFFGHVAVICPSRGHVPGVYNRRVLPVRRLLANGWEAAIAANLKELGYGE